ncbi:DUF72 domain-containing protein [Bowmanella dokdonensis]|uniref:DUF72 domain-containing protein n=1 Tax=Bowmanella dokdonensis TaxID=751969 RepID=A0A939IR93_9ALTE|nr:DUF72 domain-containing protein [Bowmanella dokdonensis]MBN7827715.1 DUF72 domain-containing protein [Bowmanella dokdonensis]
MQQYNGQLMTGCPMWHQDGWRGRWFPADSRPEQSLMHYSRVFNTVEGNTSFYQLPSAASIERWRQAVPEHFRFCFKFHQSISHHNMLMGVEQLCQDFLDRFEPLQDKIGCFMLQLSASFSPEHLPRLAAFLTRLPGRYRYGVEVRHPAFFAKGEHERRFNRLLMDHGVNRVIMDTRPLFAAAGSDGLLGEVKQKKPRLPVNVIATGDTPVVRFVGHPQLPANRPFYQSWQQKIDQWIEQGKTPYLFFHMPDNEQAPWLAEQCLEDWPGCPPFRISLPSQAAQSSLF